MNLRDQIIGILCAYIYSFLYQRSFLSGIKSYQLNNSALKKRKKGETFREWLFYSRYKEEIPKIFRMLYYCILIIHPFCLIACVLLYLLTSSLNKSYMLARNVMVWDFVWILVIKLLFAHVKREFPYERWIKKNRGQKK